MKGRPAKRRKFSPAATRQAKELVQQSGLPLNVAFDVVNGKRRLGDVLKELAFKDKVRQKVVLGELLDGYVGSVLKGEIELEEALLRTRLKGIKKASDYSRCFLDEYASAEESISAGVATVGKNLVMGTVVQCGKFDVLLRNREGEETTLLKHDIKFYFRANQKKLAMKQIQWGPKELTVAEDHLRRIAHRTDIKAYHFMCAREADRALTLESVEGDVLKGKVAWFGRFEVVLETARGLRLVVMRHALRSLS